MSKASREWKLGLRRSSLPKWDKSKKAYMQICRAIKRANQSSNKEEIINRVYKIAAIKAKRSNNL